MANLFITGLCKESRTVIQTLCVWIAFASLKILASECYFGGESDNRLEIIMMINWITMLQNPRYLVWEGGVQND